MHRHPDFSMKLHLVAFGVALAHGLASNPVLAQVAQAAAPTLSVQSDSAKAIERCEAAVAETVRRMRGAAAQELQFSASKRNLAPAAQEDETSVRGEGRYSSRGNGSSPFAYTCAYNTKSGTTSGVMFRETASAKAEPAWQPDLSFLSPAACEGASAADLKQKYPRVARIAFDSDSRQLAPAADDLTLLAGQGAVQRAPGMQAEPFSYRCEINARNGSIVSVQTTP
jgi:hypothetical protein